MPGGDAEVGKRAGSINRAEMFIDPEAHLVSANQQNSENENLNTNTEQETESCTTEEVEVPHLESNLCHTTTERYSDQLILVPCVLEGIKVSALIDSGACSNFLSSNLISRLNSRLRHCSNSVSIRLANGSTMKANGLYKSLSISDEKLYDDHIDCIAAPINYDLILGKPWLTNRNPSIDWKSNTIQFIFNGNQIVWNHIQETSVSPNINGKSIECSNIDNVSDFLISAKQFGRLLNLSQIESVHAVCCNTIDIIDMKYEVNSCCDVSTDEEIMTQKIYKEFKDIFPEELPDELPPQRHVDHKIDLDPDAKPYSRSPYRLSHLESQELKRQLDLLLEKGYISPSTSPWGAPVLFVKKNPENFDVVLIIAC